MYQLPMKIVHNKPHNRIYTELTFLLTRRKNALEIDHHLLFLFDITAAGLKARRTQTSCPPSTPKTPHFPRQINQYPAWVLNSKGPSASRQTKMNSSTSPPCNNAEMKNCASLRPSGPKTYDTFSCRDTASTFPRRRCKRRFSTIVASSISFRS